MSLPPSLGSYQVERELGRGGMGVVYLARDPRLDRLVAIKIVPDALAQNPDNRARFEREAKLLAAVNHPNIASIYEVEETAAGESHGLMLVMEYVPGDTLADRLRFGPLPVPEALEIARQIALAVECAHDGGIVHRDLKPGNVKVTPDGVVKVLDFGLAKGATASSADLAQSPTLTYSPTAIGVILGTAGYMSPEQARGKPVDRRADIWAFGCVLYECLTGRKTFDPSTGSRHAASRDDANSVQDIIAAVLRQDPDWDALPADTPPAIRELLRRCLEKDLRKRQRDIGDARLEIESAIAAPASASTAARAASATTQAGAWQRWIVSAIAAIGGIALGMLLWSQFASPRARVSTEPLNLSIAVPPNIRVRETRFVQSGRDVIFAGVPKRADGSEDPKARLYLRSISSFDFKEIPGTEGVIDWTRSPDGKSIAFVRAASDQSLDRQLVRVPIDGSSPPVTREWSIEWMDLRWLQDGDLLVQTAQGTKFFRLPSGGGAPKPTVAFDYGGPTGFPDFAGELPDRRGVIVRLESFGARGYQQDVYVLNPDTGKAKRILENAWTAYYDPGSKHLFFSRNNTIHAVPFDLDTLTAGADPVPLLPGLRTHMWGHGWFDVASDGSLLYQPGGRLGTDRRIMVLEPGRPPVPLIPESRGYEEDVAVSADGKHVAVVIANARGTFEILTATIGRPGLWPTIAMAADASHPIWSPDGRWIAFFRQARDKDNGVYLMRPDGTGDPVPVLRSPDHERPTHHTGWLPHSSGLLMVRVLGDRPEPLLVRISNDGVASAPELLREGKHATVNVVVSPDGKTALFVANDQGRMEIYAADFINGRIAGQVPIGSVGDVGEIRWADSKRFFYRTDGSRIMTASIERSPSLRATPSTLAADLATLRFDDDAWNIMPDGRIVGLQLGTGEDDVRTYNVVLNWIESARKKLTK